MALPTLTADEEISLLKRWCDYRDKVAAQTLAKSHLKLVVKIAKKFAGYGLSMMDVISEGNVGLLNAIRRFDIEKKCRLATYAMWHIRASIQEYILSTWSMVRAATTQTKRRLFFSLRKIQRQIESSTNGMGPQSDTEIEKEISRMTCTDILSVRDMSKHLGLKDVAVTENHSSNIGSLAAPDQYQKFMEDDEKKTIIRAIVAALPELNERERFVFLGREFKRRTLKDIGHDLNISTERTRQIHVRAIQKIRSNVSSVLDKRPQQQVMHVANRNI